MAFDMHGSIEILYNIPYNNAAPPWYEARQVVAAKVPALTILDHDIANGGAPENLWPNKATLHVPTPCISFFTCDGALIQQELDRILGEMKAI